MQLPDFLRHIQWQRHPPERKCKIRSFVFAELLLYGIALLAYVGRTTWASQLAESMQGRATTGAKTTPAQVEKSSSDLTEPVLEEARSQAKRKDFAQAEQTVRIYLKKQPDSAQGHFLLGYILNAERKPKRSLVEYTVGAQFHPPSADDLVVVATDYIYLRDYADADKWLTLATQWKPDSALDWYLLGRTKYNENRFQEAVKAFDRCLQLDPGNVRAENNLGLSYEGLEDNKDAYSAYRTAIQWQSNSSHPYPQPYLNLGILLARDGHTEQALPYLQKSVELAPQNPKVHEQLGRAYEKVQMLGKAQSELEKAIAIAPDISALHFQLGRIYHKEKKNDLARKEFARCAVLNKTNSTDADETPNPDSPN